MLPSYQHCRIRYESSEMVLSKCCYSPFVELSGHFKRATFSTFIEEKKQINIPSMAQSDTHLWSCHDTILLFIVRKQQLLIILCDVLLATHRWFLYLVFVFLLGAICTREALRYDFLIAEKVNYSLCFHPTLFERPPQQKG